MDKLKSLMNSKTLSRATKLEDTYLSSKEQIDSLLNNLEFIDTAVAMVIIDTVNFGDDPYYINIYNDMNEFLSNVDPKFTINVISSDGLLKYSNKLTVEDALKQPNQNTCPEVMAAVNFVWGNPMINKSTFPIKPLYPDSVASMVSAGYGLADRVILNSQTNNQYVAKTWSGMKIENSIYQDGPSPLFPANFTLRVSQNNL